MSNPLEVSLPIINNIQRPRNILIMNTPLKSMPTTTPISTTLAPTALYQLNINSYSHKFLNLMRRIYCLWYKFCTPFPDNSHPLYKFNLQLLCTDSL